jgi:hypothetical protein
LSKPTTPAGKPVSRRVLLGGAVHPTACLEVAQIRPVDKLDLCAIGITDDADSACAPMPIMLACDPSSLLVGAFC